MATPAMAAAGAYPYTPPQPSQKMKPIQPGTWKALGLMQKKKKKNQANVSAHQQIIRLTGIIKPYFKHKPPPCVI